MPNAKKNCVERNNQQSIKRNNNKNYDDECDQSARETNFFALNDRSKRLVRQNDILVQNVLSALRNCLDGKGVLSKTGQSHLSESRY